MAINYYGTCKGVHSNKYDVWVSVNQNSQDAEGNKSNVTVSFYLKRNDGNGNSAYNLEPVNKVKITIGGALWVEDYIAIDTRNRATVLLGTWTGNVGHKEDGSLNLPIEATFSFSGGLALIGGVVTANFRCTLIGKKSSLVFSENIINPGNAFECEISSVSDTYSHTIVWQLGEEQYTESYGCLEKQVSYTVPVSWVNQQTNSDSGIFYVTISTFDDTVLIGSQKYTLEFVIPPLDIYKPSFSLGLKKVNNKVPSSWDVFVNGISGVTVSADELEFKYGATLSSVSVSVGGVTKSTLPAQFDITESGNIPVSVTVMDSRGFTTTCAEEIYAYEYTPPSIDVTSVKRCDSQGVEDTFGTYVSIEYRLDYSDIDGKNSCEVKAWLKPSGTYIFSGGTVLTESPATIGDGGVSVSSSYTVRITMSDGITKVPVEVSRSIPSGNIPFNIRRGGTGASFGKFAENDDSLDVAWDMNVEGNGSFGGSLQVGKGAEIGEECNISGDVKIGGACEIEGSISGGGDALFTGRLTGILQYEELETDMHEKTNELISDIRYYPALDIVFVKLRLTVSQSIPSGRKTYVAKIHGRVPTYFTPVTCFVNGDGGIMCKAGVFSGTGDISVEPTATIPVGRFLYINGFYMPDKEVKG